MRPTESQLPIGLLAAGGRLPLAFTEKVRSLGLPVVCVGLRHMADPTLEQMASRFYWCGLARLNRMIRCFQREGVRQLVMLGKVFKGDIMYHPWRFFSLLPDLRFLRFWYSIKRDRKDDTLMLALIEEFAGEGLTFADPFVLCPELLVSPGVLTRRRPTPSEEKDVALGWEVAKEMGRLDIGQSVSVKELSVLAVEAVEGTDRAILRAGELCPMGGFVVVKVAKPQQDMRFDVPTIGCSTVETIHKAGGRVIAIEAHKTIVLDQPQTVALADRLGITILALAG